MSEPTKAQGDEAENLARKFAKNYSWEFVLPPSALFQLIAEICTQATNDALERAALKCEQLGKGNHMAFGHDCAEAVRALQVPT